ncbi:MAG: exosome complex protein Rrp42 [Nanoarchaeota archaeon]|nr:exosome complex protein Rrp42 [Nanoarchaeota archaeon]
MKVKYIEELAKKGIRVDGRKLDEYRKPIEVEYGISSRSAEGSARVKMGDTEVVAGVKIDVGEPYPDKLDEGTIMVNVELLPFSSPKFESGPPGIKAIELARVVDRAIRESGALDFKKLCIKKGEKIWLVMIDIYPINAAGNLFDACSLAALAALKDAKFPELVNGEIDYKKRSKKSLPLKKLPLECTVYKIKDKLFIDPIAEEEEAVTARLTVGVMDNGNVCAMQKGGEEELDLETIKKMIELAIEKTAKLREAL